MTNIVNAALRAVAGLATLACMATPPAAWGQGREGHPEDRGKPDRGFHSPYWDLDSRFRHDHYYPSRGTSVTALPPGNLSVIWGGGHFYFHGGVWFRASGPRFVVVAPPVGVVIPLLPPAYVTLQYGGVPYYYANGVYYTPAAGGYTVVAAPPGIEQQAPPPPAANPDFIVYPSRGQDERQIHDDREACAQWAAAQARGQDASVYRRAATACLEGRGYAVR
jgi:hypothetical protein